VQFYEKIKLASCGQMIDVQHYSQQSSDEYGTLIKNYGTNSGSSSNTIAETSDAT
jgi:hypothetical protein